MEIETKKNQAEITQITFKLSPEERLIIQQSANDLDINVSEYCRLKCLADENAVIEQRNEIETLEKELLNLKVKLAFYKNSERNKYSIVLNINEAQNHILTKLYSNFETESLPVADNIIAALIHFSKLEVLDDLFHHSTLTPIQINDAFYNENDYENTDN